MPEARVITSANSPLSHSLSYVDIVNDRYHRSSILRLNNNSAIGHSILHYARTSLV